MLSRYGVVLMLLCVTTAAKGAVVEVTSTGFLVKHEISVKAPPAQVYDALIGKVGSWWNPQHTIKTSPRVTRLLSNRRDDGRIAPIHHVYRKWTGAHWILASLADIGYPPEGGWPAEERFYKTGAEVVSESDLVDWTPVGRKRMNEWVTADALAVLQAAGRLSD